MVRLNRTLRNVLITSDEVKFHAPTTGEEGERTILNNIIVAEERFVATAIGYEFYEYIADRKNILVTNDNLYDLRKRISDDYAKEGTKVPDDFIQVGDIVNSIDFVEDEWIRKLWYQYLWKITAECVELMTLVPSWLQTTKAGQQLQNPASIASTLNSASGVRNDVKFKMDNALLERIEPLLERMHNWICRHKINFPKYNKDCSNCDCCGGNKLNNELKQNIGFSFGHYDDYERFCK